MSRLPVLAAAEAERRAGRLWKARDRLHGAVAAGADQRVLELLGTVLADMGDLPAAGAAWFLTSETARSDERRAAALDALAERSGGRPEQLARLLPVTAPLADYPADVQVRLRDLSTWLPERLRPAQAPPARATRRDHLETAFAVAAVIAIGGTFVTGVATILVGLTELIGIG